jgi:hypothetical protein
MVRSLTRTSIALATTALFLMPQAAIASQQQQHIATDAARARAIAAHTQSQQQTRDAVTSLLRVPEVQKVAERLGLKVTNVEAAVATLTPQELERLAVPVQRAQGELAGGSTIVISTTTLLLIIIIIILLAD